MTSSKCSTSPVVMATDVVAAGIGSARLKRVTYWRGHERSQRSHDRCDSYTYLKCTGQWSVVSGQACIASECFTSAQGHLCHRCEDSHKFWSAVWQSSIIFKQYQRVDRSENIRKFSLHPPRVGFIRVFIISQRFSYYKRCWLTKRDINNVQH